MGVFSGSGRGLVSDMRWKDIAALIRYCNFEQRKMGHPWIKFQGKGDNLVDGTLSGYTQLPLQTGYYFCIGINYKEARHSFLLECSGASVLMHDSLMGKKGVPYNTTNAQWIRRWVNVFPIVLSK